MSVTEPRNVEQPTAQAETQFDEAAPAEDEATPLPAAQEVLLVDDEETPIAKREAVSFGAVHAEGLDPTDYFNYVVIVERIATDETHTLYVRSYDAGPAACRATDWGESSELWWAGNLEHAKYQIYELGVGHLEGCREDGTW